MGWSGGQNGNSFEQAWGLTLAFECTAECICIRDFFLAQIGLIPLFLASNSGIGKVGPMDWLPVLQIKFYWDTTMSIHLCIVYGSFHTNSYVKYLQQRLHGSPAENIYFMALYLEKKVADP